MRERTITGTKTGMIWTLSLNDEQEELTKKQCQVNKSITLDFINSRRSSLVNPCKHGPNHKKNYLTMHIQERNEIFFPCYRSKAYAFALIHDEFDRKDLLQDMKSYRGKWYFGESLICISLITKYFVTLTSESHHARAVF